MTTVMRDFTRLDTLMQFLRENPKVHEQDAWFWHVPETPEVQIPGNGTICGTQACCAGWAVLLDHENYTLSKDGMMIVNSRGMRVPDHTIAERARDILGLSYDEGDSLFHGANTWNDIEWIVAKIKDGSFQEWYLSGEPGLDRGDDD